MHRWIFNSSSAAVHAADLAGKHHRGLGPHSARLNLLARLRQHQPADLLSGSELLGGRPPQPAGRCNRRRVSFSCALQGVLER